MFDSNKISNKDIGENAVTQNVQGNDNIVVVKKSDKFNSDNVITINNGDTVNIESCDFKGCQFGSFGTIINN